MWFKKKKVSAITILNNSNKDKIAVHRDSIEYICVKPVKDEFGDITWTLIIHLKSIAGISWDNMTEEDADRSFKWISDWWKNAQK